MKKLSFVISLFAISYSLFAVPAYAAGNCQPIYGGGQTCVTSTNILIDKKVQNPTNGQFIDNLSVNDPRFSANQDVTFQLTVTNTGSAVIDKTIVKDVLPQYISFVSGPGSFDTNSKTLTFEVANLAAGESRTFTVTGKVSADKELVMGTGVSCVVNQSSAQIISNGQMSQDNSQFCIQKGVIPTTKGGIPTTKGGLPVLPAPTMTITPPTGPEMAVLPLLSGSGLLGWFLRKRASR